MRWWNYFWCKSKNSTRYRLISTAFSLFSSLWSWLENVNQFSYATSLFFDVPILNWFATTYVWDIIWYPLNWQKYLTHERVNLTNLRKFSSMYWSWKLVYSVVKIRLVLKLWLHISSLSAWLARLWEVTVKSGLVVIVSETKEWNKDNLAQYSGNKWVIPKHSSECKIWIENVYTYTTMVELFAV